ncbi:MAG: SMP-30/gluconolactonase/LRE family protein [Planctomycetota bacterium]
MLLRTCALLLLFCSASPAIAQVFPGTPPEELWNEGEFTEGVAAAPDGRIYFSDIPSGAGTPGRILVYDRSSGKTEVFCADSRKSNGLAFDGTGQLLACCGANEGGQALMRFTASGVPEVVVGRYQGRPFNAPNDLVVHPRGLIYFSDPRYVGPEPLTHPQMLVYCWDPASRTLRVATDVARKPNGIEVSPDGQTLYVAETDNGASGVPGDVPGPKGLMQLLAFSISPTGRLSSPKVLVDFGSENGIDGMAVDRSGRIFAAVRSEQRFGIAVYDPAGKELDFLATPALPTNCGFGMGDDSATLYITAGRGLYRTQVAAARP